MTAWSDLFRRKRCDICAQQFDVGVFSRTQILCMPCAMPDRHGLAAIRHLPTSDLTVGARLNSTSRQRKPVLFDQDADDCPHPPPGGQSSAPTRPTNKRRKARP